MHTYSAAGVALTKRFEALRLVAYRDSADVLTVGYGHTGPDVKAGQTISVSQAEQLLAVDLRVAVSCVNNALTVPLTQCQFDALVDFTFNAGTRAFLHSTLLEDLNRGDYPRAAAQFGLWVHAGGAVLPGLVLRRKAERDLFLNLKETP